MKCLNNLSFVLCGAALGLLAAAGASAAEPYKLITTTQTMGVGGTDYVYAENEGRRLYIPRGNQTFVFDLDTLKSTGVLTNGGGHGVAVDPKTHHGFCSRNPVTMFDTTSLAIIANIPVQGNPDGILFEPATERVYVFSHRAPNLTVINSKDGSIAGTVDLGGAPEQAVSDGQGHVYVDIEDKDNIAVVDAKTLKVTAQYSIAGKGGEPAGLGFDAKNHILFAMCHEPATCVVLSADDGKILATLPIGQGTDGGGFNPNTMEAFSSQRNGTLTIIKENSPTSFEVEQTVQTKRGARTSTLDTKNNHIILITVEPSTAPYVTPPKRATNSNSPGPLAVKVANHNAPANLDILVVGK